MSTGLSTLKQAANSTMFRRLAEAPRNGCAVVAIAQVDLEIVERLTWAWLVHFSRAIEAPDAPLFFAALGACAWAHLDAIVRIVHTNRS